ncbi:Integral membrane protein [Actinomyces succiniciruminis]|uniref:Integral membrane protein n=2 Tax=Actinomyces succiniciruminis TaxID=1522002 RepID=A0A1L7RRU9_9ACTO|nr:Integral membrane protein [Actinomyces succiniciruminis]
MVMSDAAVSEVFPRRSTRGVFVGLSVSQCLCLLAAGVAAVGGMIGLGLPAGPVITSPLWVGLAAAALVPVSGKPLVGYVPVAAAWLGRGVAGQRQYVRPVWRTRPAGTLALPGSRARLRQVVDEATGAVFVHDPAAKTLAATIAVTHGQFMVVDDDEQASRVTGWAAFLGTVGQSGGIVRIQTTVRSDPDASVGAREHWRRWPTKAPEGSPARVSYEALLNDLSAATEVHRSTITIVMSLEATKRAVRDHGGGMTGAAAVMRSRMHVVEEALPAAGLTPAGWLGPDELALIIRAAYDPARSVQLERHPELVGDLDEAGPMAVEAHWAHLRTDSGWHKVMRVGWPRRPVAPGFLHQLLMVPGVRMTLTHIYEPVRTDKAVRAAEHDANDEANAVEERAKVGRTETVLQARDRQAVDEHLTELDSGWTDADHVALVVIAAASKDGLGRAFEAVRAAAGQSVLRVDTLIGQQDELFDAATLPLGLKVS